MFRLLKRLKTAEWLQALVSLVFIVAQVWLDLKLPDYMSEITRLTQMQGSAMGDIWLAGGKMLLCALGSVVSAVIVGFFAARIAVVNTISAITWPLLPNGRPRNTCPFSRIRYLGCSIPSLLFHLRLCAVHAHAKISLARNIAYFP